MSKILLGPEQLATTTAPGLMSAADKNKLDTVVSDSSGNEYIKGTLYVNCDSNFANGTSVVKTTDYASTEDAGIIKIGGGLFIDNLTHKVSPEKANDSQIKAGSAQYRPIVPEIQHKSVFYGLAKAAGDSTQSASSNAVGVYTDEAKSAIQNMLGIAPTTDAEKLDKSYEVDFKPCLIKGIPTDFLGSSIWTDGENIYYSNSSSQYVLNKSTSTWIIKNWTGLTDFIGDYVWTDGENIYYSGSSQYVLDKSTSTWSSKTWSELTNFYGSYVWSDGDDIYYSRSSQQYVLNKSTSTWSIKAWTGLTDFDGYKIWSDGDNIYYSNSSTQYILDQSTSTWSIKTWTGLTSFNGNSIWSDGDSIYYSSGSIQCVLDKAISTWSTKTWSGLTNFNGSSVWIDGENIYYSDGTKQYILDKSTSTWSAKEWTGLTTFNGSYVWTDEENIYYSNSSIHYIFDKSTLTWSSKAWSGLTNYYGNDIWTDGNNIYYSNSSTQYVLDKSTSTWSSKIWSGLTNFNGRYVWTDGDNVYYSSATNQYILDKSTSTWSSKTWIGLTSFNGDYVWTDGVNIYYGGGYSNHYVLDKSTSTWSSKIWTGLTNFYGNAIWTDGDNIYYSTSSTQYILDKSTSTWSVKKWTELTNFYGSKIWSDGDNIYYGISYKLLDSKPKLLLSDNCEFSPVAPDDLIMSGATSSSAGSAGFVPTPMARDQNKYLKGDGTWSEVNALPGVTTADNGKVLLVNAGTWTASTILLPTKVSDLTNDSGYLTSVPVMTGATSSVAGAAGLVPAPATTDIDKFLAGDGTYKSGGLPMVILSYGSSTWAEFEAAYSNNVIVYCRASSNSNPASGSQTRMAFMAYVNNATNPTSVEFQYYRSVSSHSATQMGDQVFIYKLDKTSGWSVTTREASIKQIKADTGTALGVSWSSNVVTLTNTMTADDMPMSSSDATTAKSAIDTLNSKVVQALTDNGCSDLDEVKTLLTTTASTMSGGESKLLRIYHTDTTSGTPMMYGIRYEGYLVKQFTNEFTWTAHDSIGRDIVFAYGNNTWTIYSLNSKKTTIINSSLVTSDLSIISLEPGAYQISDNNLNTSYIPAKWGTLIVSASGVTYKTFTIVDTSGNVYVRHANGISSWHSSWQQLALNSKFNEEKVTITTGYDTSEIDEVSYVKHGTTVTVRITVKAGVTQTWHNGIATGMPAKILPKDVVYGTHRINTSSDLDLRMYSMLNENGTLQFIPSKAPAGSVPISFTYPVPL